MSTATEGRGNEQQVVRKFTKEDVFGSERRWRRFGEPVPAGESLNEDGTPDYGLFGPGSVVWEVLLHPATLIFLNGAQVMVQTRSYNPIQAGLRDHDPISIKAQQGTLTTQDAYDRLSRNAGMHAPMWLGDNKTAQRMWKHLHNIHKKVAGDIIDVAKPQLGGYAASEPRESMWAALTEMHPMLRVYEAFAFRDGKLPHRLPPQLRDRFVAECAAYLRLVGAPEEEIPTSMSELGALYEKYADLFQPSKTMSLMPGGIDHDEIVGKTLKKNFHISHLRGLIPSMLQIALFNRPIMGALPAKTRKSIGVGAVESKVAVLTAKLVLPLVWLLQKPPFERYILRRMWGPDAMHLIESARHLHRQALAERAAGQARP
ncbi:oxygenase MpaB family protein [Streptomyces sp. NPDC048430]|uniref:oxygenase MpaB family protein n=1 Tax=Streptomyces sp. NPDC048430 TaxID=3155388 RepID=UPI0034382F8B